MTLPNVWEEVGYKSFDGIFWFRRTFRLPDNWDGSAVELHLGRINDNDTTWVNGHKVGDTNGWHIVRSYRTSGDLLRRGENVVVVRVLDTSGVGGLMGGDDPMEVRFNTDEGPRTCPLSGEWVCRPSVPLGVIGLPPQSYMSSPSTPTVLYNAMIAPLQSFPIKGVIWYQGESNSDKARQYRDLFPCMIADWREGWNSGEFPFLFVQITPHFAMSPEIREAQFMTLSRTPATAMVVTTDVGDARDIHPTRKGPVGARLALAARALAYREPIEYSGPLYQSAEFSDGRAVLQFTHTGGRLEAMGGKLKGFTIAGADKRFVPATAEIKGDVIVVSNDQVKEPIAVRYGWANVPDVNLYNKQGLPASPFRTDAN
jgi:sialate O-acetylesterase